MPNWIIEHLKNMGDALPQTIAVIAVVTYTAIGMAGCVVFGTVWPRKALYRLAKWLVLVGFGCLVYLVRSMA